MYKSNWIISLKKIGLKPIIKLIKTCKNEYSANYAENFFIKLYGREDISLGKLTNLTDGGAGVVGMRHSLKTKQIMSLKRIGIKFSEETKRKLSESKKGAIFSYKHLKNLSESHKGHAGYWTGKNISEETKIKISNSNKGRIASLATRIKISKALTGLKRQPLSEDQKNKTRKIRLGMPSPMKGRIQTYESRKKMSNSKSGKPMLHSRKPVVQIDINNGSVIKEHACIIDAEKETGINSSAIAAI